MMNGNAVIPFHSGSPMTIAGPTGSGKTYFVNRLLSSDMFTQPIASVLYCYGVYQDYYDDFKFSNLEFHQGVPTMDKINAIRDGNFHVIVLDDLMEYIVKSLDVQSLFTKHCHHYNMTAIFITQNIFAQGPCARNINLNTHILVLFANKRDKQQVDVLGKQLFPTALNVFREAYYDAIDRPYGYLIVDCSPMTPPEFQLRTNIFPGEESVCYIKKV